MPAALTRLDGRLARTERSRTAVVDALLDLLNDGNLKPTAAQIADSAGVSLRSVFQHFKDLEALFAAAADRQMTRLTPIIAPVSAHGALTARIDAFVRHRALLLEAITPVRRAAVRVEPFSSEVSARLRRVRTLQRAEVAQVFAPELAQLAAVERREVAAALAAASSWSVWENLRRHQGVAAAQARKVMARSLAALLA